LPTQINVAIRVSSQLDGPLKPVWSNSTQPIELGWFLEIGGLGWFKKIYDKSGSVRVNKFTNLA